MVPENSELTTEPDFHGPTIKEVPGRRTQWHFPWWQLVSRGKNRKKLGGVRLAKVRLGLDSDCPQTLNTPSVILSYIKNKAIWA